MRTRIKVFTCWCHANPCAAPCRWGWRQARSFLSPSRPKPSPRRLQPLAARCKGVWGSREWAVLDSLFAIVFFNRPSLVKIYQKYLIGFMGHCGPRPFNVENRNALHPNLSLCSWSFIRSVSWMLLFSKCQSHVFFNGGCWNLTTLKGRGFSKLILGTTRSKLDNVRGQYVWGFGIRLLF